jgi:hypothetical protein
MPRDGLGGDGAIEYLSPRSLGAEDDDKQMQRDGLGDDDATEYLSPRELGAECDDKQMQSDAYLTPSSRALGAEDYDHTQEQDHTDGLGDYDVDNASDCDYCPSGSISAHEEDDETEYDDDEQVCFFFTFGPWSLLRYYVLLLCAC